jgi:hypothetical protein
MQLTSPTDWDIYSIWDYTRDTTCKALSNTDIIQQTHISLISDNNYCNLKLWDLRPEKIFVFNITYKLACFRSSHMKFEVFIAEKTYTLFFWFVAWWICTQYCTFGETYCLQGEMVHSSPILTKYSPKIHLDAIFPTFVYFDLPHGPFLQEFSLKVHNF